MRLTEFSYKNANWELKPLEFGKVTLIVGKNATGKTRTISQLSNLFKTIGQATPNLFPGKFNVKFLKDNNTQYSYAFEINGVGIFEKFCINSEVVLKREPDKEATLLNVLQGNFDTINPPANKLVIHVNRDIKKYPFLEDVALWSEKSYSFRFASITSDFHNVSLETNLTIIDDITRLYSSLNISDQKSVLDDLNELGYLIDKIGIQNGSPFDHFLITEQGIKPAFTDYELSQGMLRSLYLIIFVKFLISTGKASTILVDDLCEGLDYERATKLGKKIFDICVTNNIQLIATSNDNFLMDVVDLQYWNVLQRKHGVVTAINVKNHPQLFESFKFTGLSNFDFFASDYIPQKTER